MARSHSKSSVHRAQPAQRFVNIPTTRKTKRDSVWLEQQHTVSHLPQVRGKILEDLEFISAPEYKGISLSFRDKTFLDFKIETFFTVKADYLEQKTGKHRVLKKWASHGRGQATSAK